MSRPAVREIGDRNAYWHYQETGFGSWLWIYQGRGRTGILLPPQWHRGRLRRPPGWREGSVRNRVEPQGPARQERPRRLSSTTRSSPGEIRGSFFWGLVSRPDSLRPSPEAPHQARDVELRSRVLRIHLPQRLDQDHRHRPVAVDLVVGGDDVPRRAGGRAPRDRQAVRAHVVVPVSALVDVVLVELPALVGILQPVDQALALLRVGDVQAELHDLGTAAHEPGLEVVDLSIAAFEDPLRRQVVYPGDKDVFVVRAVEDADVAGDGQSFPDPPEKAAPPLLRRRLFESCDQHALRVEVAHDVGDGAVLARRIHALKDDEQRAFALGV